MVPPFCDPNVSLFRVVESSLVEVKSYFSPFYIPQFLICYAHRDRGIVYNDLYDSAAEFSNPFSQKL
jgi:hypothetical protein